MCQEFILQWSRKVDELEELGVKLVLANALLAGLLNVIPNVGPTISTVFPMAVAILDAPWKAAAVLGAYILIQNLEDSSSVFYILSNNHINELITHPFDFERHEEVPPPPLDRAPTPQSPRLLRACR